MIRATREFDYSSAYIRLREPDKSEDKAEGRALVIKGAEEVENTDENSKYQDRTEGQRPRNFIRPISMGFLSRSLTVRDFELMQECSTKKEVGSTCYCTFFTQRSRRQR
ncbi:hypothetical protein BHE74_00000735 [Ensete ventricosum]|nr:hypothetical protein GW17_00055251 [Ensete ventricosum]RWW90116.1 hypothetical protein BHE74_00000735 [Ensete ventricosum]